MVWGMALPENYGEFWPRGTFELDPRTRESGWGPRLQAHFAAHATFKEIALFDDAHNNAAHWYAAYAKGKFIDEHSAKGRPPFTPVEPHQPPKSFDTAKFTRTLGSLIMLTSRMVAVDEALKEIIERLEPNVNQFFPFELRMPKGKIYPGNFSLLVMRYLDTYSPEDTKVGSVSRSESGILTLDRTKGGMSGLAMRKTLFGDAHLWRERRFSQELVCFSDALQAEIERAGLRLPKLYRMIEVDSDCAQSAREAG